LEEFVGDSQFSRSRLIDEDLTMQQDLKSIKVSPFDAIFAQVVARVWLIPIAISISMHIYRLLSAESEALKEATLTPKRVTSRRKNTSQSHTTKILMHQKQHRAYLSP
jgi:hypothetical protein